MKLTTLHLIPTGYARSKPLDQGVEVEVEVQPDGMFTAQLGGESFESSSLSDLRRDLQATYISSRVEVPFVDPKTGAEGVIRGFHANQRDVLVTWTANGKKDKQSTYAHVLRPEDVDTGELAELQRLRGAANALNAQAQEVENRIRAKQAEAWELLNEGLGFELVDKYGHLKEQD